MWSIYDEVNDALDAANGNISNYYQRTNNKKIGISCNIKNISIRGGYAIFGSPLTEYKEGDRQYLSTGIGWKKGSYSIDISMTHAIKKEEFIVYRDNSSDQIANIDNARNTIIATINYNF